MGKLADEMTRLADEVRSLRSARGDQMRQLRTGVEELRADLRRSFALMSETQRSALAGFVRGLRDSVGAFRQEVAADMLGARLGWSGGSPAADVADETRQRHGLTEPKGVGHRARRRR